MTIDQLKLLITDLDRNINDQKVRDEIFTLFIKHNNLHIKYDINDIKQHIKDYIIQEILDTFSLDFNIIISNILPLTSTQHISDEDIYNLLVKGKYYPKTMVYHPNIKATDIMHSNRLKKAVPVTASNHPITPIALSSITKKLIKTLHPASIKNSTHIMGKYTGGLVIGMMTAYYLNKPFICLSKIPINHKVGKGTIIRIEEPHLGKHNKEFYSYAFIPEECKSIIFIDDEATTGQVIIRIHKALQEIDVEVEAIRVVVQSDNLLIENLRQQNLTDHYAYIEDLVSSIHKYDIDQNIPTIIKFNDAIYIEAQESYGSQNAQESTIQTSIIQEQNYTKIDHSFRGLSIPLTPSVFLHAIKPAIDLVMQCKNSIGEKQRKLLIIGTTPSGILAALSLSIQTNIPLICASNRPEPKGYKDLNLSETVSYISTDSQTHNIFGLNHSDQVILVCGELENGDEQNWIIHALKQHNINTILNINVVHNHFYKNDLKVPNISLIECSTDTGIPQINKTAHIWHAIKTMVLLVNDYIKLHFTSGKVHTISILPSSLILGASISSSDIDEMYIIISDITQQQADKLYHIVLKYLTAHGVMFEPYSHPKVIALDNFESCYAKYEMDSIPLIKIFQNDQFIHHSAIKQTVVNLLDKHIARIFWLYSINELDLTYIKNIDVDSTTWTKSAKYKFHTLLQKIDSGIKLTNAAITLISKLEDVFLSNSNSIKTHQQDLEVITELLSHNMIRLYDDKILMIWRHGSVRWSDSFWNRQIKLENLDKKQLEKLKNDWLDRCTEYQIFLQEYNNIIEDIWDSQYQYPLVYELILQSWKKEKILTTQQKNKIIESFTTRNAFVFAAAIELASLHATDIIEFLQDSIVSRIQNIVQNNKKDVLGYFAVQEEELHLLFRLYFKLAHNNKEYYQFILDNVLVLDFKYRIPSSILKFIYQQFEYYKDKYNLNVFYAADYRYRITSVYNHTTKKIESVIVHDSSFLEERKRLLTHLATLGDIQNIIFDWDKTLNHFATSDLLYSINRKIAFWINYLVNNGMNIIISTAASYERIYEQAFNLQNESFALKEHPNLYIVSDVISYKNNKHTEFYKFPLDFEQNIQTAVEYLLSNGWIYINDGRPSRYLYNCYNKSFNKAVEDSMHIENLVACYNYHITLAETAHNNWALKIHHATKNAIFRLEIPNLYPNNSIFIADESMKFGVDTPLFENKELKLKIDVGEGKIKYHNTINTELKNEAASLAFLEAFVISNEHNGSVASSLSRHF